MAWISFSCHLSYQSPFESMAKLLIGQNVSMSSDRRRPFWEWIWTDCEFQTEYVLNDIIANPFKQLTDFLLIFFCRLCFNSFCFCQCFPSSHVIQYFKLHFALLHYLLLLFSVHHSHLPLSQCHRSFSPHLPPTSFMLQIGAAGCHDVRLAAPTLAGMASFLWWHNVVVMSYAFKQWFDVTAVSASLSNAGAGCHIPAGNVLSEKLISAAHHHKKFPDITRVLRKSFPSLTKIYYLCGMHNRAVYMAWSLVNNTVTQTDKCGKLNLMYCFAIFTIFFFNMINYLSCGTGIQTVAAT